MNDGNRTRFLWRALFGLLFAVGAAVAWNTRREPGGAGGVWPGRGTMEPIDIAFGSMATSGRVRIYPGGDLRFDAAREAAESALRAIGGIEALMSPYAPGSDVHRLNHAAPGEWVDVAPSTWTVAMEALRFHALTGGAFDPTIAPLKRLFFAPRRGNGLDPGENGLSNPPWPADADVALALTRVGADYLRFDGTNRRLALARPGMGIDFSALAKGYAVDEAWRALSRAGVQNALIEIGGEIRLMGVVPAPPGAMAEATSPFAAEGGAFRSAPTPGSRLWQVEIKGARGEGAIAALSRTNCAIATSGDEGHYREHDGVRYSHVIDPRAGYPLSRGLISVTVVVPGSCLLADATATALSVLGRDGAMAFLGERADDLYRDGIEVWWVFETDGHRTTVERLLIPGRGLEAAGVTPGEPIPARVWNGSEWRS